jgi:hypothetical protein
MMNRNALTDQTPPTVVGFIIPHFAFIDSLPCPSPLEFLALRSLPSRVSN